MRQAKEPTLAVLLENGAAGSRTLFGTPLYADVLVDRQHVTHACSTAG